jgi:hypothetical protein
MRDLLAEWLPIAIVVLVLLIIGGTLIYILSGRLRRETETEEAVRPPAPPAAAGPPQQAAMLDSQTIGEGVAAIHALSGEVRALRDAVRDLGHALRERPAVAAAAPITIPPGQPLTVAVRGVTGLDKLVDLERIFERSDAVQTVGIQSYRQGRGEFVVTLNRPLVVDLFRLGVEAGIGSPVGIDAVDPVARRLELRIEPGAAAR